MANLASTAVTINRAWTEGGVTGKECSVRQVTLVLTGQGGGTNKILASVLSLTKIESCSNFIDSTSDIVIPAVPSYDGSYLVLADLAQATDADRADAADFTATVRGVVKGYV